MRIKNTSNEILFSSSCRIFDFIDPIMQGHDRVVVSMLSKVLVTKKMLSKVLKQNGQYVWTGGLMMTWWETKANPNTILK